MNEREKIPLVAVGLNFGRHIVRELSESAANLPVRLAGLCDLDRSRAEALAAQYWNLPVYVDLDEVLADPAVAAVGLFTGPVGRAGLIRQIVEAGKDVMTTKPFEVDPDAAQAALTEAARLGRVVHLNSPNPGISPDLAVIEQWRERYRLGRPVAARADVWAHYREQADASWYDVQATCPAAPVFRLGIYAINDLVRVFGRARRVSVFATRLFTGRATADNAQLAIEFESGALANVYAGFCVRDGDHYRGSLTLNFESGTVYREVGPARQWIDGDEGSELAVVVNDGEGEPRRIAARETVHTQSGKYDWAGFAKAVRREPGAPEYDPEHIVEPLRIIAAMAESERTGQIVEVKR